MPEEVPGQAVLDGAVEPTSDGIAVETTVAEVQPEPVAASPDFSIFERMTPADLKAAAEKYPNLQSWREEGFEAGRQKRERELRMEQGSREAAIRAQEWLIDQLNQGADPAELAKQTPIWVQANEANVRAELFSGLATQAADLLGDDPQAATIRSLVTSLEGKPDELQQVATAAMAAVQSSTKASSLNEILNADTLEVIPTGSKLRAAIAAKVEADVAAELRARAIEANKQEQPPATPSGKAPGASALEQLKSASTFDDRVAQLVADPDLRARAWDEAAANVGR